MQALFKPLGPLMAVLQGHELRAVGGAVRAAILGEPLEQVEIDLCTPSLPEAILASARAQGAAVGTQGLRWGCVQVNGYDITTLRAERYDAGNRYPQVRFTTDWQRDAARRDFTCNAVYLAPDGSLTDPYGGAAHLRNAQIIWVEDPRMKLAQDPLRWWRWLRFCAMHGPDTLRQPRWATLGGMLHPITLTELATVAASAMGSVSATRRAKETEKFNCTAHAATVRRLVAAGLAERPDLADILVP